MASNSLPKQPRSAIKKLASSFGSAGAAPVGASFLKNSSFLFDAAVDASFCSLASAFVRLTCSSDCVSKVVSRRTRPLLSEASVTGGPARPNSPSTLSGASAIPSLSAEMEVAQSRCSQSSSARSGDGCAGDASRLGASQAGEAVRLASAASAGDPSRCSLTLLAKRRALKLFA
ncbi:hypothetical protein MRX96_014519 [Rhipicephalus microplus]